MKSALAIFLLAGCAASTPAPPRRARPEPAPAAPAPIPVSDGTLSRGELDAVLDAGIPAFLAKVETEPETADGRFVGFRIVSFFPGDARFAAGPVRVGDVVLAVNGLVIERPEHLFRVWQELRVASGLDIDILRGGRPERLSYPIE